MTEQIHDTSDPYIVDLLNNACNNPAHVTVEGKTIGKEVRGYNTYRVETHCTAVTYTAKVINRDLNNMPTRYRIIHRDYEAC